MTPFVKICGMANSSDMEATAALAPDAIGFVFWPRSPRAVDAEQVADWETPAGILRVGVFVDQPLEEVRRIAALARLDVAQLHGSEDAGYIRALGLSVWKALHVDRLPAGWAELPVERFLVDSGTLEMPGGTGIRVDIDTAAAFVNQSPRPVLLAGGLKWDTVRDSILAARPAGVDVSSGVESEPGRKDMRAVRRFIENARSADLPTREF